MSRAGGKRIERIPFNHSPIELFPSWFSCLLDVVCACVRACGLSRRIAVAK